jgi:UDP-N-acetylglucosamine 2-epimerase (non-hydrolysing)
MIAYEKIALADRPDWLVVVGDVNSTAACAMVAAKLRFPVVHLEAGLRSRDRDMPEEINRLVTDVHLADVLWTPSPDADENLAPKASGRRDHPRRQHHARQLRAGPPAIEAAGRRRRAGLEPGGYGVVTLHRPSNVDDPAQLARLVDALIEVQQRLPLVFPSTRAPRSGWRGRARPG